MRVETLQRRLSERGEAAALITSPENIRYFTGFYTWNALVPFALGLIPARGNAVLLVPRADEALARAVARCALEPYDPGTAGFRTTAELCRSVLDRGGVADGAVAIESGAVPLDRARVLEEVLAPRRLTDVTGALAAIRLIKDPDEQRSLRDAAALVASAMGQTVAHLHPGVSELEIKAAMDLAVHSDGARRWPGAIVQSQTNVVSGGKLNRLHDAATGQTVGPGEMLFVLGDAAVNGYRANIARTLFVPGGAPSDDARRALDAAAAAQRAAISRLVPGALLREAVQAADEAMAASGLAGRRTYPLIRGLGLGIAERPRAADAADLDLRLAPGMCMCVQLYVRQPAYIVGRSDSVLVTSDGPDLISEPRDGGG
ncbi:MAG TPA: M24 family metallopeptidase [bacterium]|nr:M24 family metallopeptidase [bacterium]